MNHRIFSFHLPAWFMQQNVIFRVHSVISLQSCITGGGAGKVGAMGRVPYPTASRWCVKVESRFVCFIA